MHRILTELVMRIRRQPRWNKGHNASSFLIGGFKKSITFPFFNIRRLLYLDLQRKESKEIQVSWVSNDFKNENFTRYCEIMKILIRVQSREGDCFIRWSLWKRARIRFFIRNYESLIFGVFEMPQKYRISRPTCQILFFNRILVRKRIFRCHDWKWKKAKIFYHRYMISG